MTQPTDSTQPAGHFTRVDHKDAQLITTLREDGWKLRTDGWMNLLTGIGNMQRDKRLHSEFQRLGQIPCEVLEGLYHDNDLMARICELPADEMTREWIELSGDDDNKLMSKLQSLNSQALFSEAETWARLYGGSLIILGAFDGQAMDQPLIPERVTKFDWMMVVDRWDVRVSVERYKDPQSPRYGQPIYYDIVSSNTVLPTGDQALNLRVHESRVLRFNGARTGRRRMIANQGWHDSVVQRCYEVVRDFNVSYDGAANMLQDFSQAVFKIKNLASMLASDKDDLVLKRLKLMDMSRSVARAVMLDAEGEEFERKATPVTGMSDLLMHMGYRLSAATDMPLTLLLGMSPGGLQATGDNDQRNWYNKVRHLQVTRFTQNVQKLLQLAGKSIGVSPKEEDQGVFKFTFKPLWQPTDAETAETRLKVAQADNLYFQMGTLDPAEIAVSRWGGDSYSMETTIDTELREPQQGVPPNEGQEKPDGAGGIRGVGGDQAVQDTALNGIQVTSMKEIVKDVALGELSKQTAKAMLQASFPLMKEELIDAMLNGVKEGELAEKRKAEEAVKAEQALAQAEAKAKAGPPGNMQQQPPQPPQKP